MANKWLPAMGTFSSPPREDEGIAIRRRVRHSASHIGGAKMRQPILLDVHHLAWQDDAACISADPEAFFPEGTPEITALKVCSTCPVKQVCADYALDDPTLKGIWGGLNEKERRRIREKRAREARREAS